MKRVLNLILLTAFVSLPVGCSMVEYDGGEENPQVSPTSTTVSLQIGKDATKTKAGASFTAAKRTVVADLADETGIEGLIIEETDVVLDEMPFATKGTPAYTSNFADLYQATGFNASKAFVNGAAAASLAPAIFSKNEENDRWAHEYGSAVAMPEEALFFFHAPATLPAYIGSPSYNANDESVTFSLVPANYPKTATAQTDVLFSVEDIVPSEVNQITFHHVFASVKFKNSNPTWPFQITKVEISNLLNSGTCTIKPSAATVAEWTPAASSTYAIFSQTYDGVVTYGPDDEYFSESFYSDNTYKDNLSLGSDTKATTVFNCVPQSFSKTDAEPVTVTVTYKKGEETKTAVVDFSTALNGKKWEAGHLYTYALSITELSVSVEDTVSGDTKQDVVITNTGNTSGYIRAAIVANWVKKIEGDEVIVMGYDPEEELTGFDDSLWVPGPDGYYYYKYGVNGGKATKIPLFESFTAPAPTIAGATLQMTIHAQIVKDRTVWGSSVPAGLSNTIEN